MILLTQVAISEQYLIPKAKRDHGMDKVHIPNVFVIALLSADADENRSSLVMSYRSKCSLPFECIASNVK